MPVTTVDELWYRVEAAWSSVSVHSIQSLFDSMPRRINAVITARGGCLCESKVAFFQSSARVTNEENRTRDLPISTVTQVTPNPQDRADNEIPSPTNPINRVQGLLPAPKLLELSRKLS
ncbi:hypothetical protein TNCV_1980951 [Trichonephila clavipes]|nr:hypothetical protein TNCV_1980951 [Trichonephila clavipes]